ncbi:hypothetical protein Avbf_10567 [Armadillidium vulgare]|nr:hypothetical protein Avbf_10567 [Armadillidium vulgare]
MNIKLWVRTFPQESGDDSDDGESNIAETTNGNTSKGNKHVMDKGGTISPVEGDKDDNSRICLESTKDAEKKSCVTDQTKEKSRVREEQTNSRHSNLKNQDLGQGRGIDLIDLDQERERGKMSRNLPAIIETAGGWTPPETIGDRAELTKDDLVGDQDLEVEKDADPAVVPGRETESGGKGEREAEVTVGVVVEVAIETGRGLMKFEEKRSRS